MVASFVVFRLFSGLRFGSIIVPLALLPSTALGGNVDLSGGLEYFITLRSSSLSHGTTFAPSFVDGRRMLERLDAALEGDIEMSFPKDYSRVVVTWQDSQWAGRNPDGILNPGLINIPFPPKLKVDYGFSDVDGNFIKNRDFIKIEEVGGGNDINPNKPIEITIDWSKQKNSSNARIKFDIEENKEVLFGDLVSRIPVSAIRGAFAFSGSDRYSVVTGSVFAKIEMFKNASDIRPVEVEEKVFPIFVHYFLEDDIQIAPVQGHENLSFGRVALPSDKGYWLEIKPENQTLSNLSIGRSSYTISNIDGKKSSSNPVVNDVVKRVGSLAAFEINGAPNVMKEPVFNCGNRGKGFENSSGHLSQQMVGDYDARIPIYIEKHHTKFLTKYNAGYSSYTLIVGGKIFVSRGVPSGLYRSTCNIEITMG